MRWRTIIVTDFMVRAILGKQDEFGAVETAQLGGVLAHEIGHIEGRHSARALVRTSLTAALSAALLGDFSAVAAGVPAVLMNMRHSREMKTEADSYAIAVLNERGMPLAPLADLFDALGEQDDAAEGDNDWRAAFKRYASSHPASAARACARPRPDWTGGLCASPNRPRRPDARCWGFSQWRSLCLTKNVTNSACTRTMAPKARGLN